MVVVGVETPLLELDRHVTTRLTKSKGRSAAVNLRLWRVVSNDTGSNWWTVRRLWMKLMLWTGAAFFRVKKTAIHDQELTTLKNNKIEKNQKKDVSAAAAESKGQSRTIFLET
jgi:hypothetical protein